MPWGLNIPADDGKEEVPVQAANRRGALALIARTLAGAKVNDLAFLATTSGTEGSEHVAVDNVNKAKKPMDSAGQSQSEAGVVHFGLPHMPGRLGYFAG